MSKHDDEQFRPKVGRPKAGGGGRRFISRVVKASVRAGHPIGRGLRSAGARPGATLGRGHVASRMAGRTLRPRSRRVIIKTRLVVAKRSNLRSTERHPRYIQRAEGVEDSGIGRDLDDLAAVVHVGAASREKMTELVACYLADPLAWRAAPDAALRATFRAFVQQLAGGTGLAFEHMARRYLLRQA